MASETSVAVSDSGVKKTLSTTGVTINAMALIAPGAFLWITFQLQAGAKGPDGQTSTAFDMWQGIVFALVVAFLTALSYAEMAKIYPEAGFGSAYYFAEKTFADKASVAHQKWGRIAKLVTGWAAHLFYWVYPGVMVTFMAVLVSYIAGLFGVMDGTGNPGLSFPLKIAVAVIFAFVCGGIAVRGINGSTMTSLIINIIQLVTLVFFSCAAIAYRLINPQHANFGTLAAGDPNAGHASWVSIILPHSLTALLFQATIAILILVGFESCTALGAEAKDARKSVPIGVIWSLIIQGLFAYLFEYFAANFALSDKLVYTATDAAGVKTVSTGMAAAAASQAPIGDMMRLIGDSLFHGLGFGLTVTMAVTVALAVLATTLACINTGVRVSYAMAKDKEMPQLMGLMHGRFATPHTAVWMLAAVSAIIGAIGVKNSVYQTGIGIASNLGTFVLYMLICVWTMIAFAGRKERNHFLHMLIPFLGLLANFVMIATIFYLSFSVPGDTRTEGFIAIGLAALWAVVSAIYILVTSARSGKKMFDAPKVSLTGP